MASRAAPGLLPASSRLRGSLARIVYIDSYEVPVTRDGMSLIGIDAAALDHVPGVFKQLLVVRSTLVKPFGIGGVSYRELTDPIDTGKRYAVGDKLGRWTIYSIAEDEIITGANDKHLDFRVSVLREEGRRVVLSTAVMTHNRLGRGYLAAILPFHKFGVAQLLTNASAAGRI